VFPAIFQWVYRFDPRKSPVLSLDRQVPVRFLPFFILTVPCRQGCTLAVPPCMTNRKLRLSFDGCPNIRPALFFPCLSQITKELPPYGAGCFLHTLGFLYFVPSLRRGKSDTRSPFNFFFFLGFGLNPESSRLQLLCSSSFSTTDSFESHFNAASHPKALYYGVPVLLLGP